MIFLQIACGAALLGQTCLYDPQARGLERTQSGCQVLRGFIREQRAFTDDNAPRDDQAARCVKLR